MREGWSYKRIKDVGEIVLGKMLNTTYASDLYLKPYLKSKNINWLKVNLDSVEEMYFSKAELKKYQLKINDLLISEGGEVGKTCLWNNDLDECYIQNSVHKITLNKGYNPKFYMYYSFYLGNSNYYDTIVNQVSIKHLTYEKLRKVLWITPPFPEQIAIADYLDKKTTQIASQIALLEKKRDAYYRLKKSLIHKVVTKGLNPNVELKDSGIDWLRKIPKHWEVKRVKDIFIESKLLSDTGYEDLLSVSEYYGVAKRIDKMKEDDEYESRSESLIGYKLCKKNDLVVNIMLAWKKGLGVSDYDGIVSPAYAVYKPQNIYSKYFHYLMRTDKYIAEFKRHSKGIIDSRLRLYTERFYNIPVPILPISEQQQIADYLDQQTNKIDTIISTIDKQIAKLQTLRKSLINEVVTGERSII